jgi:hypothetical protein
MENVALKALVDAPQPSTYLHVENAQLKSQLTQMKAVLDQQFIQTVTDFLNGLSALIAMAAAGDPQAQAVLKALRETLERSKEAASPLTVIHRG